MLHFSPDSVNFRHGGSRSFTDIGSFIEKEIRKAVQRLVTANAFIEAHAVVMRYTLDTFCRPGK